MHSEALTRSILELPIFDTHSHLNAPGRPLGARGFVDIGHYFWLSQQLKGVGWQESEICDPRAADAYFGLAGTSRQVPTIIQDQTRKSIVSH